MISKHTSAYRGVLRELRRSIEPSRKVNTSIVSHFRCVVQSYRESKDPQILVDLDNATLLLRSQREHKRLLERYNPLFDLTAEERIHATARRVGLDMPVLHKKDTS
ncbi:uncharacterized protein LACBIDRAFT_311736 [Laccaria bicolor S238N-H82]|uniref:Predicted protein n=1 Tax=Laccaria bicolor (strain S238N-H82 / ATCC MYA-4686) TaxID=486041 RepID=B0CY59_LACBS|nr:uncharacterized protein LACBIDRAFT_311736 [Laccaria bicolor S238N-H82]EDR12386.1 predicted protein [Laccaria bicolor S238N-H82]|eukprot:XP_001876650.1 predicted protein [Laccaria bicolor S238N-H82]